jgi:hypothetical protein
VKAIVLRRHGGLDQLRLQDVADPAPGPGEALVRVGDSVTSVVSGIRGLVIDSTGQVVFGLKRRPLLKPRAARAWFLCADFRTASHVRCRAAPLPLSLHMRLLTAVGSATSMIPSFWFTETSSPDAGYVRSYPAAHLDGDPHTSQDVCTCIDCSHGQEVDFDWQ